MPSVAGQGWDLSTLLKGLGLTKGLTVQFKYCNHPGFTILFMSVTHNLTLACAFKCWAWRCWENRYMSDVRKEKLHIAVWRCRLQTNGECCAWWATRRIGRAECWWSTEAPHSGQQEAIMISLTFSPLWACLSKFCIKHSLMRANVLWIAKSPKPTSGQRQSFKM